MPINFEKLDAALDWIKLNPELHDQKVWWRDTGCGTAMCLAGQIAWADGWRPSTEDEGDARDMRSPQWMAVAVRGEETSSVQEAALRALGIDSDDDAWLYWGVRDMFAERNTLDTLLRMRDGLYSQYGSRTAQESP